MCSVAVVKDHNKWSVTEHQRNSKTRTSMETIFWTQYTPLIDTYSTWVKSWTELIFLMAISSLWELSIIYLCGFESSFFWGGGGQSQKCVGFIYWKLIKIWSGQQNTFFLCDTYMSKAKIGTDMWFSLYSSIFKSRNILVQLFCLDTKSKLQRHQTRDISTNFILTTGIPRLVWFQLVRFSI